MTRYEACNRCGKPIRIRTAHEYNPEITKVYYLNDDGSETPHKCWFPVETQPTKDSIESEDF